MGEAEVAGARACEDDREAGALGAAIADDVSVGLFVFFQYLPLSYVTSTPAVLLVGGTLFAAVYLFVARTLRVRELTELLQPVRVNFEAPVFTLEAIRDTVVAMFHQARAAS